MSRKLNRTGLFMLGAIIALAFAGPCFADEGPVPGPALEARQKLFDRIQQARAQGIGITGYLQAFKALEEQVKGGDSADKIGSRVESINKAVNDQIDRARILKTQKPLPPQGSQLTGSPSPSATATSTPPPAGKAGGGGGNSGDIANKIKDKLQNLPDSVKEKLLNDPRVMEKIKEKTGGQ